MYNKYFTMKRSELKEAIKAEITSVLSEQSNNPDFDKKIANFAKKINNEMDYQGGVLEAMKQIKSRLERIISKVEGAKRGGADAEPLMKMIGLKEGKRGVVVDPDEIMMHINQYQKGNIDGDDLAQAIEEILVAMMNKSVTFSDIREEDEMSDDEMDKKASRGAKKEPIGKEAERLAQVQKFMRQMQDKGIVGKDKKILDTSKYKEEFAKFKAGLKK